MDADGNLIGTSPDPVDIAADDPAALRSHRARRWSRKAPRAAVRPGERGSCGRSTPAVSDGSSRTGGW